MQFDILTIFPDLIYNYCDDSILGRAQKKDFIKIKAHDFRKFSLDKQRHVDDRPYGGGPGMILQVEPVYECLKAIGALSAKTQRSVILSEAKDPSHSDKRDSSALPQNDKRKTRTIILDPAGKKFDQRMAEKFSKLDRLVLIAGRYEGFDARIYKLADERISVGDFVLAGGELPALSIVEAVSRLLPGVLGNAESLKEETHARNAKVRMINDKSIPKLKNQKFNIRDSSFDILREYPQYTRPPDFMGLKVPKVLLSGDHKKINDWRKKQSK